MHRIFAVFFAFAVALPAAPARAITPVPAIEIDPGSQVFVGDEVSVSARLSRDEEDREGGSMSYRWYFGEAGDFEPAPSWTAWSSSATAKFRYQKTGKKALRLEVKNSLGQVGRTSLPVTVLEPREPEFFFTVTPATGRLDSSFLFRPTVTSPVYRQEDFEIRWDFDGDGEFETDWGAIEDKEFAFDREGRFASVAELQLPERLVRAFQTTENLGTSTTTVGTATVGGVISVKGFKMSATQTQGGRVTVSNTATTGGSGVREGEVGDPITTRTDLEAGFAVSPDRGNRFTIFHFDAAPQALTRASYRAETLLGTKVFRWDFDGDGEFDTPWSDDPRATHQFTEVKSDTDFRVRLQVRRGSQTADAIQILTVERATFPTARFLVSPKKGARDAREFTFDARGSTDTEDGTNLLFRWDFDGDGGWDTDWSETPVEKINFDKTGVFQTVLEVRDRDHFTAQETAEVEVYDNAPPTADFWVDALRETISHEFVFEPKVSDRHSTAADLQVRWDFTGSGSWEGDFAPARIVRHTFTEIGEKNITLEVRDGDGASAQISKKILVEETRGPTVRLAASPEVGLLGDRFSFDTAGTTDRETPATELDFRWDFGSRENQTPPDWAREPRREHVFTTTGVKRVAVAVRDSDGKTSTGSTTVTVHWASPAIRWLMENNFTDARSGAEFAPDREISRAEFAKLLVEGRGIPAPELGDSATVPWGDIAPDQWFSKYLVAAWRRGILDGYPDGWVRPERPVTRAEALKMTLGAFGLAVPAEPTANFPDVPRGSWIAPLASFAHEKGIWRAFSDGRYRPGDRITRAEAATMIWGAAVAAGGRDGTGATGG